MATCSAQDLLTAGKCFQCLTKKELQIVIAQLLCEISGENDGRPEIYLALLTQVGTDAPSAIVLENSLSGDVIWTRFGIGIYRATLAGAFPSGKTVPESGSVMTAPDEGLFVSACFRESDNSCMLITGDGSDGFDGVLNQTFVEIRVYP